MIRATLPSNLRIPCTLLDTDCSVCRQTVAHCAPEISDSASDTTRSRAWSSSTTSLSSSTSLGWAIVLGGTAGQPAHARRSRRGCCTASSPRWSPASCIVGIASAGLAGHDPNNTKIAVKLVVALVVATLVIFGVRAGARDHGLLGAIAGLTALNVAIAVLWR